MNQTAVILRMNNKLPKFTFQKDNKIIPVDTVSDKVLTNTQKLLYEDIADIDQPILVTIKPHDMIRTSEYLSQSQMAEMTKLEIKHWLKDHKDSE